mgnify:CR=1 FL=1
MQEKDRLFFQQKGSVLADAGKPGTQDAGTAIRICDVEKYYGNGLYCNQFTCRSDSRQLWNSVFEISRNGWINSLPKLGTGGGGR